jgi:predicted ATP-dependent endonuclease of OLD family
VLAEKVILVEGATEELLLQRAYMDKHSTEDKIMFPIDDGIDIIAINSLSFKRYCDIAVIIEKPVTVITDNDGSVDQNIKGKYKDYFENELFTFLYEADDNLHTIEPSVLSANAEGGVPTDIFAKAISSNGSMDNKSYEEILRYMTGNKTEWAMRVFENDQRISYPKYIEDAIQ